MMAMSDELAWNKNECPIANLLRIGNLGWDSVTQRVKRRRFTGSTYSEFDE